MNKKVIEALVEEDVGTKKTLYEYNTQNEKAVSDFVRQQNEAGVPSKYEIEFDHPDSHITLIEPDPNLTESELAILAQLNCSKTVRKLIKHMDDVKTIKNILIFFCVLACISLAAGLIYCLYIAAN